MTPFLDACGVFDLDMVCGSAPLAGDLELFPICRDTGIDRQPGIAGADAQDPVGRCVISPACRTGQPGVACPAMGGMVAPHYELAIGIGFGWADLDHIVLIIGQGRVVEFHGALAAPEFAFGDDGPGVGVAEDGRVFLDAFIDARHVADIVIRGGIGRPQQVNTIFRIQVPVNRIHALPTVLRCSSFRKNCERVAFQEDLAFLIFMRADLDAFPGESADTIHRPIDSLRKPGGPFRQYQNIS